MDYQHQHPSAGSFNTYQQSLPSPSPSTLPSHHGGHSLPPSIHPPSHPTSHPTSRAHAQSLAAQSGEYYNQLQQQQQQQQQQQHHPSSISAHNLTHSIPSHSHAHPHIPTSHSHPHAHPHPHAPPPYNVAGVAPAVPAVSGVSGVPGVAGVPVPVPVPVPGVPYAYGADGMPYPYVPRKRYGLRKTACQVCHSAKTSCDGERPCDRCLRLNKAEQCVDYAGKDKTKKDGKKEKGAPRKKKLKTQDDGNTTKSSPTSPNVKKENEDESKVVIPAAENQIKLASAAGDVAQKAGLKVDGNPFISEYMSYLSETLRPEDIESLTKNVDSFRHMLTELAVNTNLHFSWTGSPTEPLPDSSIATLVVSAQYNYSPPENSATVSLDSPSPSTPSQQQSSTSTSTPQSSTIPSSPLPDLSADTLEYFQSMMGDIVDFSQLNDLNGQTQTTTSTTSTTTSTISTTSTLTTTSSNGSAPTTGEVVTTTPGVPIIPGSGVGLGTTKMPGLPVASTQFSPHKPTLHVILSAQVNRDFERLFGYSQAEIRARCLREGARAIHSLTSKSSRRDIAWADIEAMFGGKPDYRSYCTVINKWNCEIPCLHNAEYKMDQQGKFQSCTTSFVPLPSASRR